MTFTRTEWIKTGLSLGARGVLAATFIAACLHKISLPRDFALQVATYQILPLGLVNLQALVLPWLELLSACLLFLGFWTRAAALLTCGMNLMFIIAIAVALAAQLHLQCGCFASSAAGEEMDATLIVRDLLLLALGGYLVAVRPDRFTLDHLLSRRRPHAA